MSVLAMRTELTVPLLWHLRPRGEQESPLVVSYPRGERVGSAQRTQRQQSDGGQPAPLHARLLFESMLCYVMSVSSRDGGGGEAATQCGGKARGTEKSADVLVG